MIFDLFSWWLIEIFGEEKRYGCSGRFMNSLNVPIEIGRQSGVNRYDHDGAGHARESGVSIRIHRCDRDPGQYSDADRSEGALPPLAGPRPRAAAAGGGARALRDRSPEPISSKERTFGLDTPKLSRLIWSETVYFRGHSAVTWKGEGHED
jgi:hypothetical protein